MNVTPCKALELSTVSGGSNEGFYSLYPDTSYVRCSLYLFKSRGSIKNSCSAELYRGGDSIELLP